MKSSVKQAISVDVMTMTLYPCSEQLKCRKVLIPDHRRNATQIPWSKYHTIPSHEDPVCDWSDKCSLGKPESATIMTENDEFNLNGKTTKMQGHLNLQKKTNNWVNGW
jgi:hypothetical protein